MSDDALPAGRFSEWLAGMARALDGMQDSDVPCDGCTACCTSSQFIHIGADESDTLAHIPSALLFSAPGQAKGTVVLGYDEKGHCPMLVEGACSIYEHRPRTCRTYDCRVFVASDVAVDEDKPAIVQRVARWQFEFPEGIDQVLLDAVRAAAQAVRDRTAEARGVPPNATQHAALAIELHEAFLPLPAPPDPS
jgi:hypothetical protein